MTIKTALLIVLLWGILFACVGSAIGAVIGTVAPGYYQSIFRDGHSSEFNPLQVGVGLGATQGVASGVAMSIVVLALLAWRDIRSSRPAMDSDAPIEDSRSRTWSVHVVWGIVTGVSVLIIGAATFVLGLSSASNNCINYGRSASSTSSRRSCSQKNSMASTRIILLPLRCI